MADIKNKNELKRRIELFMDELDYSDNKEYCMETMRMMREFIGHASHRLDCANSKIKSLISKVREYQKLEEQGFLLRLPCKAGTSYWTFETQYWIDEEKCRECKYYYDLYTETFCDCEEDYPKCTQIVEKIFLNNLEFVSLMNQIGKTVFLTKEEAEQALKHTENAR